MFFDDDDDFKYFSYRVLNTLNSLIYDILEEL